MSLVALSPPRFACTACGACCHGVRVELVSEAERLRMLGYADELGLERQVVDGRWLVQEGGRCAFQGDDERCEIHRRHGADAKPATCRQFPHVLVRTETGEVRVGIDPCAFFAIDSWRDGPVLPPPPDAEIRDAPLTPEQARAELALLKILSVPGMTLAGAAAVLCGQQPRADLPQGFAKRLVTLLQRSPLPLVLQARDVGQPQVRALEPLMRLLPELNRAAPPAWPALGPEEDAFAVEVMRRMLFLRLATRIPFVQGVAMITLVGLVANAWAAPDRRGYGAAVGAWSRLMRAGPFWQAITPEPAAMQYLAFG